MSSSLCVVLDVNVIVSGFLKGSGAPAEIARRWEGGHFEVALSKHIISQVIKVWKRPYFAARIEQVDMSLASSLMHEQARSIEPDPSVSGIADDEEDDVVLGTAVAAGAQYLVTGDKGLLAVRSHGGVAIVTAREFLTMLDAE